MEPSITPTESDGHLLAAGYALNARHRYGVLSPRDVQMAVAEAHRRHPAPPALTFIEVGAAERKKVIARIRRYRESFDAVRAMHWDENWPLEKQNNHLDAIRTSVGSKTTHVIVKHSYLAMVRGIEMGTCSIQMRTYGLTDLLSKSAEIDSILKEVAAEMGVGAVPPTHRLALATIGAVLQLDSANKKAEVLAGFQKSAVNENIPLKYEGL